MMEVGDRIGIGVRYDDQNRAQYFICLHGQKGAEEVSMAVKSTKSVPFYFNNCYYCC